MVRLGETNWKQGQDPEHRRDLDITRVINHPNHNGHDNDVALASLCPTVVFNVYVQKINVATAQFDDKRTLAIFTGWGLSEHNTTNTGLQQLRLQLDRWGSDYIRAIGRNGSWPSKGDSGGPLSLRDPHLDEWMLIGVLGVCGSETNGSVQCTFARMNTSYWWIGDVIYS